MTGMSSLIGYTRLQVPHLSAEPLLTRTTGVLQLGQARISSSSWSTGMPRIYDTFQLLWNNSVHEARSSRCGVRRLDYPRGRRARRRAGRSTRSAAGGHGAFVVRENRGCLRAVPAWPSLRRERGRDGGDRRVQTSNGAGSERGRDSGAARRTVSEAKQSSGGDRGG